MDKNNSITEHYHSFKKLSFSLKNCHSLHLSLLSAVSAASFVNQLNDVIKILSYVAYVTLSLTVLSHALNYVSQQLCLFT